MWVYLICWFHKVIMKSGRSSTFIFLGNNALMLLTWLCSRSSIDVVLFFGGLIFLKAVRLFSAVKIGVFEPCHLLSLSCWIWEQLSQQSSPVLLPWQFARHPADISNLIFQRLCKSLPSTAFCLFYPMNRTTADYKECWSLLKACFAVNKLFHDVKPKISSKKQGTVTWALCSHFSFAPMHNHQNISPVLCNRSISRRNKQ